MKRLIAIAGVIALGACSESAPAPEPVEEAEAEEAATDWSAWAGSYDIAYEDGSAAVLTVRDTGTYEVVLGEDTLTGTVEMGEGGEICYTNDDGETPTQCWTNSEAAEDGSWTSTSEAGETVTVTRIVPEVPGADEEA